MVISDPSSPMQRGLLQFLQENVPGAEDVRVDNLAPIQSVGNARQPWGFDVRWRDGGVSHHVDCVMLVKAPAGQLETELGPEFNVMRSLWETGVPVPRTLWMDGEGRWIERPFFITEKVPGTANFTPLRQPEAARTARAITEQFVAIAAELHTVDWKKQGVDFLEVPTRETAAARQIAYWEALFLRHRMEPSPVVVHAFEWLKEHQPVADRISIVHGDYRFGNFLYDGNRITALLDWEMVHLGDPVEDLAWAYRWMWTPEPFMPLEEFLARYTELSGIQVRPETLLYYRLFNELKHAMIALTGARAFADGRTRNLRMADRVTAITRYMLQFMDWLPDLESGK